MNIERNNSINSILLDLASVNAIQNNLRQYELIFFLLKEFSFRISEVLRIKLSDCIAPNKVIVKLSKCSSFYIIRSKEVYNSITDYFNTYSVDCFDVNYKNFYRWFIKYKPNEIISNDGINRKITHSFRYKDTTSFTDNLKSEKEIQALLRHNSIKSQKYYKRKKLI